MNHHAQLELLMRKYKNLWGGINLATMNPYDFEELMAHFFSIWYVKDVRFTKKSQDHGIDAYIKENDKYLVIFQMKRYNKKNKIDERTIRDLYGCMADCGFSQGYLPQGVMITTGSYSQPALDWATGKKITLITGRGLVKLFHKKGFNNIYLDFDETPTKIANKAQQMEAELKKRAEQKKHLEEIKKHNEEIMAQKHEQMRQDALKHQKILQEKEEQRKKKIQEAIARQAKADNKYKDEIFEHINSASDSFIENKEDCDELLDEAIKIIVESRQVSASYLQRRLKIGFNRAVRIIEELESSGIISAKDGNKPSQVLISKEDEKYKKEIEEIKRKKYEEQKRLELIQQELERKQLEAERKKAEKQLAKVKLRHEKEVKKQQQEELERERRKAQAEEIRLKRQEQKELREKKRQEREVESKRKLIEQQQNFKEKYGWRRIDIRAFHILEMCAWIVGLLIPAAIATYLPGGTNNNMYVLGIYINVALFIHIMWKYIRFKNGKNIFEDRNILMILLKVVLGFLAFVSCMASYWVLGIMFLILLVVNYYVLHKIFIKETKSN